MISRTLSPAAWASVFALALLLVAMPPLAGTGHAQAGTVQGRVIASDTGEPVSYANVALVPADTTQKKLGTLTNSDGSFRIPAPPGTYTLVVQAISYTRKRLANLRVQAGQPSEISVVLEPEALLQEEVVVEADAARNTEAAMLAQRRKADSVGDAVSAEQVRKSPDKDAAEVLRRVTGISVVDGKYVYVRGLGERYSSTSVDGVQLVSPEQNKRVVPMDMLPAALLENVVIQKTYTADRPGEFGGGDVQVHTKDFPGKRTLQLSLGQEWDEGTSFEGFRTYGAGGDDWMGNGAGARELADAFLAIAGDKPVVERSIADPARGYTPDTLALLGSTFDNVWTPRRERVGLNGNLFQTFGDEWTVFGRQLGFVQSLNYRRSRNQTKGEKQRFYNSEPATLLYDYDVERSTENVQLGGMAALSYRLSPSHSLHLRGLYSRSADDEVRFYEGYDENDLTQLRSTRLLYTQRSITTGGVEGRHEFARLGKSKLEWRANLSRAMLETPDRREAVYEYTIVDYDENDEAVYDWVVSGDTPALSREFGDQDDDGWGVEAKWATPFRFLGGGAKLTAGYSYQEKDRNSVYRRFEFIPSTRQDTSAPPESLFAPEDWTGSVLDARLRELTRPDDSYTGHQRQTAGFVSADLPVTAKLRGILGVRLEKGVQDVKTFDLFDPSNVVAHAQLADVDWLPSANLNYALTPTTNLRAAASRTLSRPDMKELAPTLNLELIGGARTRGNPDLKRAKLDNYDLRLETFPALGEVLAVGVFYKKLHHPIERIVVGGDAPLLLPVNSESGRNYGLELEARTSLGRITDPLSRLFVNLNLAWISSTVALRPTDLSSQEHPLLGQPNYLVNGSLSYTLPGHVVDATALVSVTGKRLDSIGLRPRPDIYEDASTTFDLTVNARLTRVMRLKVNGKNLLDTEYVTHQGEQVISTYKPGRSVSIALSYAP